MGDNHTKKTKWEENQMIKGLNNNRGDYHDSDKQMKRFNDPQ